MAGLHEIMKFPVMLRSIHTHYIASYTHPTAPFLLPPRLPSAPDGGELNYRLSWA